MPESTYLQTILRSFATLDIGSLESILKREYTYQDTTAEIFLREMGRIFNMHKDSGDTHQILYEGKCVGTECPSCGKRGYRFVGNHSGAFMDLVFECEGDDITDIYSCEHFMSHEDHIPLNFRHELEIAEDEKITFNITPEYLSKLNAAQTAMGELIQTPPRKLTFRDLSEWVQKHAPTNLLLDGYDPTEPTMKWTPFLMLYSDLRNITHYITEHFAEISRAVSRMAGLTIEEQLIQWLTEYEEAGNEAPWTLKYTFRKHGDCFRWNDKHPILFMGDVFHQVMYFLEYYEEHYTEMFQKYTTYSDEEASTLYNLSADEQRKTLFSLRFHLEKRKSLQEEGITLPLYINFYFEEN